MNREKKTQYKEHSVSNANKTSCFSGYSKATRYLFVVEIILFSIINTGLIYCIGLLVLAGMAINYLIQILPHSKSMPCPQLSRVLLQFCLSKAKFAFERIANVLLTPPSGLQAVVGQAATVADDDEGSLQPAFHPSSRYVCNLLMGLGPTRAE